MARNEANIGTMVTTKGSTVLHSVLYVSTAQVLFTAPRMEELLTKSRASNARQQITGLLLYRDGAFMQFLEGPEGAVERLFRKIKADERHFAIVTISEGAIPQRRFPDSPMGFHNLRDHAVRALPGFAEFAETSLSMSEFCDEPGRAMQLLGVFERGR
ncbi:BLUF domain protein [Chthoniobacter flavus Ellin428]|uniref:BLUF domain protein n=2 Tax=Chthoniobacter flavus TaxID=191863 RepID=B4D369_9BACT|nr:BLUF domain protein [Chthoniobacter flavus Ellin428]TCO88026.1 FAD-dependent sensor of blue light [Chthoniobacter flavus]